MLPSAPSLVHIEQWEGPADGCPHRSADPGCRLWTC